MIVKEFYRGYVAVGKAKRLAQKNGWKIELIPNANGCYGMYARTDVVVTRPMTPEERSERLRKIKLRLSLKDDAARIERIVPKDVLDAAFTNCFGKPRIAIEDCHRLGLVTPKPKNSEPHVDFGFVLKCNWPSLSSYLRFVIYSHLDRRGPYVWDFPNNDEINELTAQQSELLEVNESS